MNRPGAALTALLMGTLGMAAAQPPILGPGPGVRNIASQLADGNFVVADNAAAVWAGVHNLPAAMKQFKPTAKGGLGVADLGIEQMLRKVARDEPSAANMKRNKAAYVQMAYDIAAIGLVLKKMPPDKNAVKWNQITAVLGDESRDLARAAKDGDPKTFKAAAMSINTICAGCHKTFR